MDPSKEDAGSVEWTDYMASCRRRILQYLAAFFLLGKISQKVKFKIEVIFDCQTEKIYLVKIFKNIVENI
jgi:hypothetical protein